MPAQKREYRLGKNIFQPGKLYAGLGNAEVDPGPTYVGQDINIPAGHKYANQDINMLVRGS
jgi:hypothetical protein